MKNSSNIFIEEHPDYFLREIASHFSVSLQAIFYALRKLKITRKKRLLSIRKEMKRKEKICLEFGVHFTFNTWLKEVLVPNLKPRQVLILDNASFHKSAESKKIIKNVGCDILFLPPYSPDLNPIEKYWANMKVKIRELLPKVKNFIKAFYEAILSM